MVAVITGGSGSGKSEYAENLARSLKGERYIYIATMRPWDEEGMRRIEKHQRMRSGKGFETMERYTNLHEISFPKMEECVFLLECMSNLTANEFYANRKCVKKRILESVFYLMSVSRHIIIVTNEVFSDGLNYRPETREYMEILGWVNKKAAAMADIVTEVVYGIPIHIKGGVIQ